MEEQFNMDRELAGFTGTENYYKHWTGRLNYTDGVQHMAQHCPPNGSFWLLDVVVSYQHVKVDPGPDSMSGAKGPTVLKQIPFQLWKIELLKPGDGFKVTCREDTGTKILVEQTGEYTDFPQDYEFYVSDGVILLKSEY